MVFYNSVEMHRCLIDNTFPVIMHPNECRRMSIFHKTKTFVWRHFGFKFNLEAFDFAKMCTPTCQPANEKPFK